MKITFPNKTAEEIVNECHNKVRGSKLLWNIDWYKNENFYTKEKCRLGTREVNTDLTDTLGKTWNECKEKGDMLNFAELLWVIIQCPDFLNNNCSWTSSRTSGGFFVYAGDFGDDGGNVHSLRPRYSHSTLGCAFSAVKLCDSSIETLKGDETSSRGADEIFEKCKKYIDERFERVSKDDIRKLKNK